MCTSVVYKTKNAYFGRNLDLEYAYKETITITPRNFPLHFRTAKTLKTHHAIIGVAYVTPDHQGADYPLYYDAINEAGLGISGLMFAGTAKYFPKQRGKDNIAQFELIPWILAQCANIAEAKKLLSHLNILNENFSKDLPISDLHWLISDATSASITVESCADGLHVYDNPVGVLTNNPAFPAQLFQLNNYMPLSPNDPPNTFSKDLKLWQYSRGLGTRFLPGGLDSGSRFVRATFTKLNSVAASNEISSVSQFFHILHSCDQARGCDDVAKNEYEITLYTSCYNLTKGIAYYTCYDNHQISCVDMHKTDLDAKVLTNYPLITTEQICYQN